MQKTKVIKLRMGEKFINLNSDFINFDEYIKSASIPTALGPNYYIVLERFKKEYTIHSKLDR